MTDKLTPETLGDLADMSLDIDTRRLIRAHVDVWIADRAKLAYLGAADETIAQLRGRIEELEKTVEGWESAAIIDELGGF